MLTLPPEENTQFTVRNSSHEKPLKGETEVRDILFMAESEERMIKADVTVTYFLQSHSVLKNYQANQIAQVLNKIGIKENLAKVKGKTSKLRNLPVWIVPKNGIPKEE